MEATGEATPLIRLPTDHMANSADDRTRERIAFEIENVFASFPLPLRSRLKLQITW